MDYWTKLNRSMFQRINEVGAKPFLLFQYYLTWKTAPEGINPSAKTVCLDMGLIDKNGKPQLSALSQLKKILIESSWIEEKPDGEIVIIFDLENESKVKKILSTDFRKSKPLVKKILSGTLENLNQNLRKSKVEVKKILSPIYKEEKYKEKYKEKENKKESFSFEINEVFQFWQTELHPNGKLSDKRKQKILARLKNGYTVEQIKQAITACKLSDFHTANGHTDIELICRDEIKLDGFLNKKNGAKQNGTNQNKTQTGSGQTFGGGLTESDIAGWGIRIPEVPVQ